MLYSTYDIHAKAFRKFGSAMKSVQDWWSHPWANASAPHVAHYTKAASESLHRMFKEYPKPDFNIEFIVKPDGTTQKVFEDCVWDLPFCKLIRFTKENNPPTQYESDCLIVAPLSGHYATLLRDTITSMLNHSDTIYVTDWKNARDVPLKEGVFGFADYVTYVERMFEHIGKRIHTIAVCQPTVPVLVAASRMANHASRPLSMTLIGGPVDARKSPTKVDDYATEKSLNWFKSHVISHVPFGYAGVGRKVYPGFLQHFGFVAMNPQRHAKAYNDFYKELLEGDEDAASKHRAFYDEYNAVLDMDAQFYLDTIEEVFQKFSLAEGTMHIHDEKVRPELINDIALFTIEGEKDDIAGVGQTQAAHQLCTSLPSTKRKHWIVPGVGHYGVFSGSAFRSKIAPVIAKWHATHSKTMKKAR